MNKSRIEYENLIRTSILFSLDRETQTIAYKREALKMVEYLYLYLTSINADKYSEYGLEITQTAKRCIKNYTKESGDFLNYFNSAISKEYRKAFSNKHFSEQHGGVHIPEQEQRIINKFIKLAETKGVYDLSDDLVSKISEATGIKQERIRECISLYQNSFIVEDTYTDDEGNANSIFDYIASDKLTEDFIIELDTAKELLEKVDQVFQKRQDRQKPLLSKLITAKISQQLQSDEKLLSIVSKMSFFDLDVFKKSITQGSPPTAKEIGEKLGLSEQSVSRTFKEFIKKLENIKEL